MPLTTKGKKIMKNMKSEYGAEKGKEVFYASQNKGTIKGTHEKGAADAYAQGFCEKCAAIGVDPELLVKQAYGEQGFSGGKSLGLEALGGPLLGGLMAPSGRKARTFGSGIIGSTLGAAAGTGIGAAAGFGIPALLAALSKGKINPSTEARLMSLVGGTAGGYGLGVTAGGAEGIRRGSQPGGKVEQLIAKLRAMLGK